jgi:ZIP family zinc transporter
MAAAMAAAAITFFSTLGGGYAALKWPRRIEVLMALAGGVVLATALLDLLPEAVNRATEIGMSARVPIGCVLVGYLVFHAVERYVHRHDAHGHAHGHGHPHPLAGVDEDEDTDPGAAGIAGATGFVIHSFFDGLAIGLGFRVDSALGVLVAAAVIAHDFSDGLNTVSYLTANRQPLARSRKFLFATATTPLIGAAIASLVPLPDEVLPIGLGFFSGLFIYAAATNLLPSAQGLPLRQSLPVTVAGATVMFLVSQLA